MSGRWWIVAVSLLLFGSLSAGNTTVSGVDIDVVLSEAPVVEYRSGKEISLKKVSENRWLMIKIGFSMKNAGVEAKPQLKRGIRGYTLSMGGFVDDLQLDIRVLQNTGMAVSGKPLWGMFTGRTRFYTIRMDGKQHLALMFVPGKLIDRFSCSAVGGIRKVSKDDFRVEVILSAGGRELYRKYRGVSGIKEFEELCKMVPENMVMTDGVFPRSRTPWAYLGSDNLDLERFLPVRQEK